MDDDLRENDSSILDGNGDGASENDPSLSAVRDAEEGGVTPGFLGGNDWASSGLYKKNDRRLKQDKKKENAAAGLASAEKSASENNLDGVNVMKKEASGGSKLFSGSGKKKSLKKGRKKGFAGKIKKSAPILAIVSGMVGAIGLMSGSQNLLPIAIEELIIEKFNSIGISSTMASDDWLDTQLNQGVRLGSIKSGESENLFAFSDYQVQQFKSQGILVVGVGETDNDTTQITALLYQKDGMYVPVVGSDFLNYSSSGYSESELKAAIAQGAVDTGYNISSSQIGTPISAQEALKDSSFKNPYTTASKAWRGGASGWFDNIMEDITEAKLSVTRNRWSRWVAKAMKGVSEDFKKIAKSANLEKTSDGGALKAEEVKDEDGKVTGEEQIDDVEYDMDGASEADKAEIESKNGNIESTKVADNKITKTNTTAESIGKVLNSKAIKAASAIADYGCALLEGLVSIYTVVSAYQSLQFLNLISGFLESVDKVKAGDGSSSPIHEYSTNLTTKADTKDDNDKVVAEDKTAVESAGLSWLFGKDTKINNNDSSVRNVNFETIMSNMSMFTSNISLTASVYEKCGYVKAGVAAVDLATTVISFIPIFGQAVKGVQLTVKAGVKIAVKAAVQIALYAVIPIVAKNLAKMMIEDAATEWFGEDLGNAIVSGANKYVGGNGTSGGQSPGSSAKVAEYLGARDTVIAEEARYQRSVRSPFDITSRYTFLGNLAYSVIPLAYSSGLMANISSASSLVNSSALAVLPTASAISEQNVVASTGDCDLLGSTGAIGDAFCNPYIITDTSTMATSPIAVNNIVHSLGSENVVAADGVYEKVKSGNFDDNGSIKKDSDLARYITYCGQRTSQYGIKDATIASQLTGEDTTASKIIGVVPGLNNLQDIYTGLASENGKNLKWANGSACVASEENDYWDEYKWYQRYAENERLLENMNPGYTSTVTAYLREYYKENPLDQSFEGTIARFTGMSKEKVEDTLALIDYYEFLNEYNPNERYAFGRPDVEVKKELKFDNGNSVAERVWGILLGQISYADVRNRSFAV